MTTQKHAVALGQLTRRTNWPFLGNIGDKSGPNRMESIVSSEASDTTNPQLTEVETSSGTVSVVQVTSLPGQALQVQNTPTVISPSPTSQGIKAYQVITTSDGEIITDAESSESKKRRELLARRPSYRRILNELSGSENQQTITVAKIEEESDSFSSDDELATNLSTNASVAGTVPIQPAGFVSPTSLKVIPAQTIQIAAQGEASTQGLQTLTMTNVSGSNGASPTGGATILQYAQSADGQFIIPVSALSSGSVQYQLAGTTASLPQGVVMASAGSGSSISSHNVTEEASRKRELRLLKNREAARECRRKKKEYVKCLENRVAVLENQNKTLIEELKSLKELYCQKDAQS